MPPRVWTPTVTLLLSLAGWVLAQGPSGSKPPDLTCPGKPPRFDPHGDPLPGGAIARLGTVRLRHPSLISGIAFSGDGKSIFASDFYSGVHVWDAATGTESRRLYETDHFCHALAVSPDGRTLAVALGDTSIRLCDPATGKELGALPRQDARLNFLTFSPDGSRLATGFGRQTVRLYEVATRRLERIITFPDQVGDATFSGDGKMLAAGNKTGASLWDLDQNREVRRLEGDPGAKHSLRVAYAPVVGPMAVWGYDDGSVRLFDATGTKELRRIPRDGGPASPGSWGWRYSMLASFSPDGKVLAIARDVGRIELWDVESGKRRHTLAADTSQRPSILVFSPDGTRLASTGSDNWGGDHTIRLWDVVNGKELHPRTGHGAPVTDVAVSLDGRTIATAGRDGIVHLWDGRTGQHQARLEGAPARRYRVAIPGDGRQVIAWGGYNSDGALRVWDTRTGRLATKLDPPAPDGFWETVSDDGKVAVSVDLKGRALRFHDLAAGAVLYKVDDGNLRPVALSPTGDKLIGGDGAVVALADRKGLVDVGSLGYRSWARFSADGRRVVAAVMHDGPLKDFRSEPPADELAVVDLDTGKAPRRFGFREGTYFPIETAALSGDGRTVVTIGGITRQGDEQVVTVWEVETGRERTSFRGHLGGMTSAVISADGRRVVTGSVDTSALVWDVTRRPAAGTLGTRFAELGGDDATRAYAAHWAFVEAPKDGVTFLRDQATLFESTDVRKIQGWIRGLDGDRFADRERATRQLALVLDEAAWHLKKALDAGPSAEARRRIEELLRTRAAGPTGRELQRVRVIEILERIAGSGEDAAGVVLEKFAAGPPGTKATRDAQASLERLGRRGMSRE